MCYNTVSLVKKKLKEAKHQGASEDIIRHLGSEIERLSKIEESKYHQNGFGKNVKLPAIFHDDPDEVALEDWGLLPNFVKPEDVAKRRIFTLNARVENLFSKPSWKSYIGTQRCVIVLSGFHEYHHFKSKKYPFFIHHQNIRPMLVAGLWNDWLDKSSGEITRTISLITRPANEIMSHIHNNPKNPHRMPALLSPDLIEDWISPLEYTSSVEKVDQELISELAHAYQADDIRYYTVPKLTGKEGVYNTKSAIKRQDYEPLEELEWLDPSEEVELEG